MHFETNVCCLHYSSKVDGLPPVAHHCIPDGFCIDSCWIPNGFLMDSLWMLGGFLIDSWWIPDGFLMDF